MKYASILCLLSGAADDAASLLAAAELARRETAQLKIIPSLPLSDAVVWGDAFGVSYIAASTLEEIADGHIRLRQDMSRLVQQTAESLGLAYGETSGPGVSMIHDRRPAWQILDREAPLADLIVIGEVAAHNDGFWGGLPGQALMNIRAPMLIVRAPETLEGGLAAIAWDGSHSAGRAVRAALPLLRAASSIVILQDAQTLSPEEAEAGDPARLSAYLALHGLTIARVIQGSGRKEGAALAAAAEAAGASVLIAGAYGHSRLGEALRGGATRDFTSAAAGPHLLLAH